MVSVLLVPKTIGTWTIGTPTHGQLVKTIGTWTIGT